MNCFFRWEGATRVAQLPSSIDEWDGESVVEWLLESAATLCGLPEESLALRVNGRQICSCVECEDSQGLQGLLKDEVSSGFCTVSVCARLLGGKGGFGSLLRGQKGGRRRTRNIDACRDLQGRRIRHARALERLDQWLEKKKQDDALVTALGGTSSAQPARVQRGKKKLPAISALEVLGATPSGSSSSGSCSSPGGRSYLDQMRYQSQKISAALQDISQSTMIPPPQEEATSCLSTVDSRFCLDIYDKSLLSDSGSSQSVSDESDSEEEQVSAGNSVCNQLLESLMKSNTGEETVTKPFKPIQTRKRLPAIEEEEMEIDV